MQKPMCLFNESDYAEVRSLVAQLPEREFRILFLRYWASYSITQIAEELKMNWDAVDKKLNKALNALRGMYPSNPFVSRDESSAA